MHRPYWGYWEALAEAGFWRDAMVAYVEQFDHVTFVELQKRLAPFMPTEGTFSLDATNIQNVTFWAGMSETFIDTIQAAIRGEQVFLHPSEWLCYFLDGGALSLPLVKRLPKNGYKTLHWAPAVLRTVPLNSKGKAA